jgi:hypothetical protein
MPARRSYGFGNAFDTAGGLAYTARSVKPAIDNGRVGYDVEGEAE